MNNEKVFDILMDARSPQPITSVYGDMDDHISPIIPAADESEDINFPAMDDQPNLSTSQLQIKRVHPNLLRMMNSLRVIVKVKWICMLCTCTQMKSR